MSKPLASIVILSDRPTHLPVLLHSLRVQTCTEWEALVLDQGDGGSVDVVQAIGDARITAYKVENFGDWGQTVKAKAINFTRGSFLGFPNDDAYYAPRYIELMLEAALRHRWDLVYCDWVFDKYTYRVMDVRPRTGWIDVGGFLVRRDVFELPEIDWSDRGPTGDGILIEKMVAHGCHHGKAPGVLYVKN